MDMTLIDLSEATRTAPPALEAPAHSGQSAGTLALRWEAIHDAAGAVAAFARLATQPLRPDVRHFPQALRDFGGWRRDLAQQGVEDLAAILEPGLTALLAVHDSGADAAPAAMALWQEFLAARDALLALAPPIPEDVAA